MNRYTPVKLARILSWATAIILCLLPFHAFLTVWLSSLVGHYTLLRLWKEFILVVLLLGATYLLITDRRLRQALFRSRLIRLIGLYSLVLIIWGCVALSRHTVTGKAMWYGLLVDLRFLTFFLVVWVICAKDNWLAGRWQKILLIPAMVVAVVAIVQYLVLPYDFLKHFGYGPSTISPYETINHNLAHLRVASTLRGSNPLGAYLVLPLSALAVVVAKNKKQRNNALMISFGLLLSLVFSFSRSAWIGLAISLFAVALVAIKNQRLKRNLALGAAAILIISGALAIGLRHNTELESVLYHTDHTSAIKTSSNEGHLAAFKGATHDLIHQPLGRGTGTAGPQSTYNYGHSGRIAENFFLQVGQETGWIGMLLFIAICVAVGKSLWDRRADNLALWLFASLIGLSFINLLSHAWTDDTLAYVWWGLAGICLSPAILTDRHKRKNAKKIQTA